MNESIEKILSAIIKKECESEQEAIRLVRAEGVTPESLNDGEIIYLLRLAIKHRVVNIIAIREDLPTEDRLKIENILQRWVVGKAGMN